MDRDLPESPSCLAVTIGVRAVPVKPNSALSALCRQFPTGPTNCYSCGFLRLHHYLAPPPKQSVGVSLKNAARVNIIARLFLHLGIVMDRSLDMDKPRPYVTAALLCEKVLQEKDESITLVRVIDRLQYQVQSVGTILPAGIKPIVPLEGFVSIKSGPIIGDHTIKVVVERPNGERKDALTFPVKFLGADQGQNIILKIGLGVDVDGLYWFDVLLDEDVLTRIPLVVTPTPAPERQAQT
jgi:hypothetical protein